MHCIVNKLNTIQPPIATNLPNTSSDDSTSTSAPSALFSPYDEAQFEALISEALNEEAPSTLKSKAEREDERSRMKDQNKENKSGKRKNKSDEESLRKKPS